MKYILHIKKSSVKAVTRLIVGMMLTAVSGISCFREIEESGTTSSQAIDKDVNFSIQAPSGPATPKSRAIEDMDEYYITSLYILSFRIEGGKEIFDYWTQATEKEDNINGKPVQYYTATLKVRNHQQKLVVLTNLSESTWSKIALGNWTDAGKETMLMALTEELSGSDYKWNTTGPSDFRPIPMWGESTPQTILNTTTNLSGTIPLLRMVASIDVELSDYSGVRNKFQLKGVYLYNVNRKGRVVPYPANVNEYMADGNRVLYVNVPSIPDDIADYNERYLGPVVYREEDNNAIRNAIYLFETASSMLHLEATCLVIEGIFENDPNESYYRVDFRTEYGEMRDILRNHKYTITIQDVKKSGHNSSEDAFHSKEENMQVSIVDWTEVDIEGHMSDKVYFYSVTPRLFEFQAVGSLYNEVVVETDYPQWSFQLSDKPDPADPLANPDRASWIEVFSHYPGEKYPGDGTPEYIDFDIESNTVAPRTGYIHVTAGRVTMTVTVNQAWDAPTLDVSPQTFQFQEAGSVGSKITVETNQPEWSYQLSDKWAPNDQPNPAKVSWIEVTSHNSGQEYPGNETPSMIEFNVQRTDPDVRTGYIHITAGELTKTVTVKQIYWIKPTFTITPSYNVIPWNGEQRTVRAIGGTFHEIKIRLRIETPPYIYPPEIREGTIENGFNNNSIILTVPAFGGYNVRRDIYFDYYDPIDERWYNIQKFQQQSSVWD